MSRLLGGGGDTCPLCLLMATPVGLHFISLAATIRHARALNAIVLRPMSLCVSFTFCVSYRKV